MSHKRKLSSEEEEVEESVDHEQDHEIPDALEGMPINKDQLLRPKLFKSSKNDSKRLIIILEKCNLEIVKTAKSFELLNCDQHMNQIRKYKKDPAFCRPDITHQVFITLKFSIINNEFIFSVSVY